VIENEFKFEEEKHKEDMWLWGVFFYGQAFPMAIMSNIMYFWSFNRDFLKQDSNSPVMYYPSLREDV